MTDRRRLTTLADQEKGSSVKSQVDSTEEKPSGVTHYSGVTTGQKLFLGQVDQRTEKARRFRDIYYQIMEDLGGAEYLPENKIQLARRIAALTVQCEIMEAEFMNSEFVSWELYTKISNAQERMMRTLGLERIAKPTEDIKDIRQHLIEEDN